jgi:hypothetical protein
LAGKSPESWDVRERTPPHIPIFGIFSRYKR